MLLASLLFISCSPNPGEELLFARRGNADLTLTNAEYLIKVDEGQPLFIHAAQVAMYDRTDEALISRLTFSRHNLAGEEILSGQADEAQANLTTYDTHLSGSVVIDHRTEQLRIEADSLRWLNDQKQLLSPPMESPRSSTRGQSEFGASDSLPT